MTFWVIYHCVGVVRHGSNLLRNCIFFSLLSKDESNDSSPEKLRSITRGNDNKMFTLVAAHEVATRTIGSQGNSSANYGSMNLFSDRNERNSRTTELTL